MSCIDAQLSPVWIHSLVLDRASSYITSIVAHPYYIITKGDK